jgi:hypothetical protein
MQSPLGRGASRLGCPFAESGLGWQALASRYANGGRGRPQPRRGADRHAALAGRRRPTRWCCGRCRRGCGRSRWRSWSSSSTCSATCRPRPRSAGSRTPSRTGGAAPALGNPNFNYSNPTPHAVHWFQDAVQDWRRGSGARERAPAAGRIRILHCSASSGLAGGGQGQVISWHDDMRRELVCMLVATRMLCQVLCQSGSRAKRHYRCVRKA